MTTAIPPFPGLMAKRAALIALSVLSLLAALLAGTAIGETSIAFGTVLQVLDMHLFAAQHPVDPIDAAMLARHAKIMAALPYGQGLSAKRLAKDLRLAGFTKVEIHTHRQITRAMGRGAPLARKLGLLRRQSFVVTVEKPQA